jgi:Cu/Ag efflux protein CusF
MEMRMKHKVMAALVLGVLWPITGLAVEAHHQPAAAADAAASQLADGEIRRVDRDAKKITIRHGPIPNLDMPPMTMVFQVKDPSMLDQVKAGDKVRFTAEKTGGAYTVTQIETVR